MHADAGFWRLQYQGRYRHTVFVTVNGDGNVRQVPPVHKEWRGKPFHKFRLALQNKYPGSFKAARLSLEKDPQISQKDAD